MGSQVNIRDQFTSEHDSPAANKSHGVDSNATGTLPNDSTVNDKHTRPSKPEAGLSRTKTILLISSILISMFLVGLDRTIIATAIPQISNDFSSLSDVGWYGSAYLLTCCALQLLFGKLYTFFSIKGTFISSIVLFEAASVLCGAAPNSVAFTIGRAFSGVGAAGLYAGVVVSIIYVAPLHRRPQIIGIMGALMGISSVVGPVIGGGFTSNVTWRWCFYINLPIGFVAIVIIFFFLEVPDNSATKIPLAKKLGALDVPGTALLVPGVVCLLLAVQWGGQKYPWNDRRIIALLVLGGLMLIGFAAVQTLLPRTATVPPRIFKQRSVAASLWTTISLNCGNYTIIYFLPIWFQSVKGSSASQSGIYTLPTMLSMVVSSIGGGIITTRIGYYTAIAIIGTCIMAVGAGLFLTFEVDTHAAKWIGYQIIYGFGWGLSFQVPNLAVQTCLPRDDVPTGLVLLLLGSLLGSSVFVSVGENVFGNQLIQRLSGLPGFDPSFVTSGGVTSVLDSLGPELRVTALRAYNASLRQVFLVALIPSALSVLGAVSLEWTSVKKQAERKSLKL